MSTTTPSETRPDASAGDRPRDDARGPTRDAPLTFDPSSVRRLPYAVAESRRV